VTQAEHINIVHLLGFFVAGQTRLFVFDFNDKNKVLSGPVALAPNVDKM
jgi:hypothetical protein